MRTLDLLLVLCCAGECAKRGGRVKNKVGLFVSSLADGRWLASSTDAQAHYDWILDRVTNQQIPVKVMS